MIPLHRTRRLRSLVTVGASLVSLGAFCASAKAADRQEQLNVGDSERSARLRYLRDYWVSRVRDIKNVRVLTPDETDLYGSITSFRIAGKTSKAQNIEIVNRMFDRQKVFTSQRGR